MPCCTDSEGAVVASSNLSLSRAGNSSLGFIKSPRRNSMTEKKQLDVFLLPI